MSDRKAKERAARIMREMPGTYAEICWMSGGTGDDAFIRVIRDGRQIAVVTEDGDYQAEAD